MKPSNVVPTIAVEPFHQGNSGRGFRFGSAEAIDEPEQRPKGILQGITKLHDAKKKRQRDSALSMSSFGSALSDYNLKNFSARHFIPLGGGELGLYNEQEEDGVPYDFVITHLDREINLKNSCKSLPLTALLFMTFAWSAWMKCDTYNYGFGSTARDLVTFVEGTKIGKSIEKTPLLRNARGAQVYVQSHDTFLQFMKEGIVPVFWREGHARVRQHHKVIDGIRLRQIRSTVEDCERAELREWYGPPSYCRSWMGLSEEPFGNMSMGLPLKGADVDEAFVPSSFDKSVFEARLEIIDSQEAVVRRLDDLAAKGWLDFQTKKVAVEMGLYNGQVDAFAFVQDEYIFHGDGSVHHVLRVSTANNLFRKWYYYLADALLLIMVAVLLLQEVWEMVTQTRRGQFISEYLQGGQDGIWNFGDWIALILGLFSMLGYVFLHQKRDRIAKRIAVDEPRMLSGGSWSSTLDDLSSLIEYKKQHEVVLFFFSLTILMKFFKGFRGQPRLAVLSTTFAMCCSELFYFSIIFIVIFSNFVVTSFLLFNTQLKHWSTLSNSFNECFKILMLKFNFGEMYAVHPVAASLWFWLFMIIALLIALSMLIAVILETYSFAKVELGEENNFAQTFGTQIKHLFLQSRIKKCFIFWKKEEAWSPLENIRHGLAAMHNQQRSVLIKESRTKARSAVFVVTRSTLEELDVPECQIDFFWDIWASNLESMYPEGEASSSKFGAELSDFRNTSSSGRIRNQSSATLLKVTDDDVDDEIHDFDEDEDAEEEFDITGAFDCLDDGLKAQEEILRVAMNEILSRLQDHEAKREMITSVDSVDNLQMDLPGATRVIAT